MTNKTANDVLLGNYNPSDYNPTLKPVSKESLVLQLKTKISKDSLLFDLNKLGSFYNRNTGSDTVSQTKGIGAARRWVHQKFNQYSANAGGRLLVSYFQFDQKICEVNQHRNIVAVLPGIDKTENTPVLIEAHIDSRCEGVCDTSCLARGIEDNATGTAMVMELARVMSTMEFNKTIIFTIVIGEEQGLFGANAFATYSTDILKLKYRGVFNNDVVGGIFCGKTVSPPTDCEKEGDVDSLNFRIFSSGTFGTTSKALARFSQLEFIRELKSSFLPGSNLLIMAPEDRTGRGGDHIPFREHGYPAIRFTAAHEHGDANPLPNYTDRQHSFRDTLGVDKNADGEIDSLYISIDYLKRNSIINGCVLGLASNGPNVPSFTTTNDTSGIKLKLGSNPSTSSSFIISVRRTAANFNIDKLYNWDGKGEFKLPNTKRDSAYFISLSALDSSAVASVFTIEQQIRSKQSGSSGLYSIEDVDCNIYPNPIAAGQTLNISSKQIIDKMDLLSSTGALLKTLTNTQKALNWSILLESNLAAGNYFILLKDRNNQVLKSQIINLK